jgi:hypothetical protein
MSTSNRDFYDEDQSRLERKIERLERERDELLKLFEDAPHAQDCALFTRWVPPDKQNCDCFKSKVTTACGDMIQEHGRDSARKNAAYWRNWALQNIS